MISQLRYSETSQSQHSHFHLSCEMVFVVDGQAEFCIDGHSYLAQKNSIVFISSYEQHEVHVLQHPYHRYFAMVQAAELERALPSSALPGIFKNRPAGFSHCVSLDSFHEEPERLFAALCREASANSPYAEQMVKTLLEQILILVYRACPQNFASWENSSSSRVREIQQYIEQHFTEEIRISELAERFFVNHCYLTHIFKEQVGYSPKQYILLNRLSYAKELLETSSLQVSQIAYQCGFGDTNNFIRAFREWFGLAPNQYRQAKERRQQGKPDFTVNY
ncbi:MAG: helix-turn-helix domain-containing protein [Candidatus Merdivicinus sp.]